MVARSTLCKTLYLLEIPKNVTVLLKKVFHFWNFQPTMPRCYTLNCPAQYFPQTGSIAILVEWDSRPESGIPWQNTFALSSSKGQKFRCVLFMVFGALRQAFDKPALSLSKGSPRTEREWILESEHVPLTSYDRYRWHIWLLTSITTLSKIHLYRSR